MNRRKLFGNAAVRGCFHRRLPVEWRSFRSAQFAECCGRATVSVIFLLPLVLSFVAAVWFATDDFSLVTKGIVVLFVTAAAALQFVPVFQESVHFLVPLLLQLLVCGWWYFANQLQ
jgi:hypothetical protein